MCLRDESAIAEGDEAAAADLGVAELATGAHHGPAHRSSAGDEPPTLSQPCDETVHLVLARGETQRIDAGTLEDGRRAVVEVALGR